MTSLIPTEILFEDKVFQLANETLKRRFIWANNKLVASAISNPGTPFKNEFAHGINLCIIHGSNMFFTIRAELGILRAFVPLTKAIQLQKELDIEQFPE